MALSLHTSHMFQPLDVGVFSPMKSYFKQLMATHFAKHNMEEPTLKMLSAKSSQSINSRQHQGWIRRLLYMATQQEESFNKNQSTD